MNEEMASLCASAEVDLSELDMKLQALMDEGLLTKGEVRVLRASIDIAAE